MPCSGSSPVCLGNQMFGCSAASQCAPNQACNGGVCMTNCSGGQMCNGGCCDGTNCQPGNTPGACGNNGGACVSPCMGNKPVCLNSGVCGCSSASDCMTGQACKGATCGTN